MNNYESMILSYIEMIQYRIKAVKRLIDVEGASTSLNNKVMAYESALADLRRAMKVFEIEIEVKEDK